MNSFRWVLRDKAFNSAKKNFDKKYSSLANKSAVGSGIENMSNEKLSQQLHKPIIKKIEKQKIHLSFTDSIWGILPICN